VPTRADAPAVELEDDFWRHARIVVLPGETSVHLQLDADVLAWFKAQGRGHLTRMNAVLRAYLEAHKREAPAGERSTARPDPQA
jgi:uncharacterized protein (DUF4415 family)